MSIIEIKVPQLAESITEANLLNWKKKEGDFVKEDEVLIEVETDKVVLQVVAIKDGVLSKILSSDGALVASNQVIGQLDTAKVSAAENVSVDKQSIIVNTEKKIAKENSKENDTANEKKIMPAAHRLISESNLNVNDINNIKGTGKGERVTKADVIGFNEELNARQNQLNIDVNKKGNNTNQQDQGVVSNQLVSTNVYNVNNTDLVRDNLGTFFCSSGRSEERIPMTKLRVKIAQRLLESQSTNATLSTFNEVDMSCIINLRKKHQEKFEKEHGIKLGFMSFFIKAAIYALKKFPILNASVDGNDIVYHNYFDIGVAVSSPRGLVVPIIRNAEELSFAEIEKQIVNYGNLSKEGKLGLDALTGGTFTISNGGVFGSMLSTPIINPPQSAILGVHATKDRAVVENGQIVIRPMNYLALSYDHRIIDGREAVLGLFAIKEALEDPFRLLFS